MSPASEFKFITVDGAEGSFPPADKSIRSHAIRTAILKGPSEMGASTAFTSQDTIKRKALLKGRFRLAGKAAKPKTQRSQTQRHKSDARVRHFTPRRTRPLCRLLTSP